MFAQANVRILEYRTFKLKSNKQGLLFLTKHIWYRCWPCRFPIWSVKAGRFCYCWITYGLCKYEVINLLILIHLTLCSDVAHVILWHRLIAVKDVKTVQCFWIFTWLVSYMRIGRFSFDTKYMNINIFGDLKWQMFNVILWNNMKVTFYSHSWFFIDFVIILPQDINKYDGSNYPIMNIHERTLSVLACRVSKPNPICTKSRWPERVGILIPTLSGHLLLKVDVL